MLRKVKDLIFNNPGLFLVLRRFIHNDFVREKETILAECDADNDSILDFGCGVGQYSVVFSPENYVGVDIEAKYIDYAKRNFKGRFLLVKEGEILFLQPEHFDRILAIDIFHHLSEELSETVLKEIKRLLSSSGKVIVIDLLPSKFQPKLAGKLLAMLDRGRFLRNKEEFVRMFSRHFRVAKNYIVESGPYRRQVFVLLGDPKRE